MKREILKEILFEADLAQRDSHSFLAVFDLDSTLFDLSLRVQEIMRDFSSDPINQQKFPNECQAMTAARIECTDWGLIESLERVGLSQKHSPQFFKELHDFWAFHFFSNHYLHHDQPISGSVEFVNELHTLGARIIYLTGRDQPRMYQGTYASLKDSGFPLDKRNCQLLLKPQAELDDAEFKLDVLRTASRQYSRIWLFENEPVNLHLIQKHLPEVQLVFIDTTHSGREQPSPLLDSVCHFEVDLAAFRKMQKG